MMWPPHRVKMHSTPAALSARPARMPPWTSAMTHLVDQEKGGKSSRSEPTASEDQQFGAIDGITAPRTGSNERRGLRASAAPVVVGSGAGAYFVKSARRL